VENDTLFALVLTVCYCPRPSTRVFVLVTDLAHPVFVNVDVGAECRHDARPSVQLPSVSGVDSKLGLTMVRPSLQSTTQPLALDPPPIRKRQGLSQTSI